MELVHISSQVEDQSKEVVPAGFNQMFKHTVAIQNFGPTVQTFNYDILMNMKQKQRADMELQGPHALH